MSRLLSQRGTGAGGPTVQRWLWLDETKYKKAEDIPQEWREHFHSYIAVAPAHRAAYGQMVEEILGYLAGLTTKQGKGRIQDYLRLNWKERLKHLPVPIPAGASDLYSIEDVYSTVLKNFYTLAVVLINGREVFRKRNQTLDDTHAEDGVIDELTKTVNWTQWGKAEVTKPSGNDIVVHLNNSPCFHKHGCGPNLAQAFGKIREKHDAKASLKVTFFNAYEADSSGFQKSIETMEAAGIRTEAASGAGYARGVLEKNDGSKKIRERYDLSPRDLEDLLSARTNLDARTLQEHAKFTSGKGVEIDPDELDFKMPEPDLEDETPALDFNGWKARAIQLVEDAISLDFFDVFGDGPFMDEYEKGTSPEQFAKRHVEEFEEHFV